MPQRRDRDRFGYQMPDDEPEGPGGSGRARIGRQLLFWAIVIGAMLIGLSLYKKASRAPEREVDIVEFGALLDKGAIESIGVRGTWVRGALAASAGAPGVVRVNLTRQYISDHLDAWNEALPERGRIEIEEESGMLVGFLWNMVPFILFVVVMMYFFNRQMRAVTSRDGWTPFVNSTQHARKEKPDVTFDDVAGVDEAQEEVQELIEFLRNPEKFQRVGGRTPRGVLLVGAPGTGKTLLAKAIAGEAEAPFFSLCGSDFVELFVGVGAARVRDLFRKARQNQPCIIFLDEIDAVGRKRGTGLGGGHDEREQTLNAILSEMDGFSRDEGVIVIAATNRPDVLDPALLRPGRFDREIVVDMPDLRGREEILTVHARRIRVGGEADLHEIARGTPGFTGADLEALVNEAAIRAAVKGQDEVRMADLEEARDKVRFGPEKKRSRIMSDEDRRMTAYHEAGHALAANLDENVEPLHKVTIIPRGIALGMTMVLPERDKYGLRKKECLGAITMNMAGRVAEEMFCGDVSSGAENDIKAATNLARKMVTQWGMSEEMGPISYSEEEQHVFLGNEITKGRRHSERMAEKIDQQVQMILTDCYQAAQQMCQEHRDELQRVAEALLELETLSGSDVKRIMAGASVSELAALRRKQEEARNTPAAAGADGKAQEGDSAEGYPRPAGSPA